MAAIHPPSPHGKTCAAMQAYCDCAEAAYERYFRSRAPSNICSAEEKAADGALKRFWRAVGAATVPSGG